MNDLVSKKCIPCESGVLPLGKVDAENLIGQVDNWKLSPDSTALSKKYTFKNFIEAVEFVNKIADIAEAEGHHPDIHILYNKVELHLTTHAIGGLSKNDFILAAKIDNIK